MMRVCIVMYSGAAVHLTQTHTHYTVLMLQVMWWCECSATKPMHTRYSPHIYPHRCLAVDLTLVVVERQLVF